MRKPPSLSPRLPCVYHAKHLSPVTLFQNVYTPTSFGKIPFSYFLFVAPLLALYTWKEGKPDSPCVRVLRSETRSYTPRKQEANRSTYLLRNESVDEIYFRIFSQSARHYGTPRPAKILIIFSVNTINGREREVEREAAREGFHQKQKQKIHKEVNHFNT